MSDLKISEGLELVITLEATSFTAGRGDLTSLSAVAYRAGEQIKAYHTLIMPPSNVETDKEALVASGHNKQMLLDLDAMPKKYAVQYFLDFLRGLIDGSLFLDGPIEDGFYLRPIVHNAKYTLGKLVEFTGQELPLENATDLMEIARVLNARELCRGNNPQYTHPIYGGPSCNFRAISSAHGLPTHYEPATIGRVKANNLWEIYTGIMEDRYV